MKMKAICCSSFSWCLFQLFYQSKQMCNKSAMYLVIWCWVSSENLCFAWWCFVGLCLYLQVCVLLWIYGVWVSWIALHYLPINIILFFSCNLLFYFFYILYFIVIINIDIVLYACMFCLFVCVCVCVYICIIMTCSISNRSDGLVYDPLNLNKWMNEWITMKTSSVMTLLTWMVFQGGAGVILFIVQQSI
jgi:hypothetical protein